MKLRPYQARLQQDVAQLFAAKRHSVLAQLPTGGGKTLVFTHTAAKRLAMGEKGAIVAHTEELVEQTCEKLDKLGVSYGLLQAGKKPNPVHRLQVCSIDSMRSRELPWQPDFMDFDEAHLSLAPRFEDFRYQYHRAHLTGWTATPAHLGGKSFAGMYNSMVCGPSIRQLVSMGYLVPARMYCDGQEAKDFKSALAKLKIQGGDYANTQLARLMNTPDRIALAVQAYRRMGQGRTGFVFAVDIEHSQALCRAFNRAGFKAAHLDGKTPKAERKAILERLKTGVVQLVCNVMVATTGLDVPSVSYIGLERPTKSVVLALQMAGRALRLSDGKTDALMIDHAGIVDQHGHVMADRYWDVDGTGGRVNEPDEYLPCPACGAWYHPPVCGCGHVPAPVVSEDGPVKLILPPGFRVPSPRVVAPLDLSCRVRRDYAKLLKAARSHGKPAFWAWENLLVHHGPVVFDRVPAHQSGRFVSEFYKEAVTV